MATHALEHTGLRITVALDTLVIALNKGALRSALLPGTRAASMRLRMILIALRIEARMQRRGRSVRLMVTPHEVSATACRKLKR